MRRRAVITGLGVITPAGVGVSAFWNRVTQGESCLSPITRFDTSGFTAHVAGVIPDFNARQYLDPRLTQQTDRWTHFDLVCAQEALRDARLDLTREEPTRVAAVYAAGTGGNEFGQRQLHTCWGQGPKSVSAYLSIAWFYAASIGQVSIANKIQGYGRNICADAAGGLIAVAHAARLIEDGKVDVALVGGSEASVAPYAMTCYQTAGILSSATGAYPYRPFDVDHSGLVIGEGGAAFCIESADHAEARGATVYAEILGGAQAFDGAFPRDADPQGAMYAYTLARSLAVAGVQPADIDWVLCDGRASQDGDHGEAQALQQVFGPRLGGIPASAPKSMFGWLHNGAALVDATMAILGMRHQTILPTVGLRSPDPACDFDMVPNTPRSAAPAQVLIGARGFGGYHAGLVLRRPEQLAA